MYRRPGEQADEVLIEPLEHPTVEETTEKAESRKGEEK
jgi:selenocysteine lyase/cysteine desulfurase